MINNIKNQENGRKKLAQIHVGAETKRTYCKLIEKQEKNIHLAHSRKKKIQNSENDISAEDEYVDLFEQNKICKK